MFGVSCSVYQSKQKDKVADFSPSAPPSRLVYLTCWLYLFTLESLLDRLISTFVTM